jgi:uncharacterized protein (DUF1778 family)
MAKPLNLLRFAALLAKTSQIRDGPRMHANARTRQEADQVRQVVMPHIIANYAIKVKRFRTTLLYCNLQYSALFSWREIEMSANAERKEHPISMRFPEPDIAMIDRAARLRGRSRTDFVRDAAVRAAEDVLMEHRPIRMTPEGFSEFLAALAAPAAAVPEMVELAKRPAPWESGHISKR